MNARRKKIWITIGVILLVPLLTGGVLAWRALRTPSWYTAAVDCAQWPADLVEKESLIPMRNWIARTSAGDLDDKPDEEKRYKLELTEAQINALLAKWTDNLHGEVETFRVHLHDNTISVAGNWSAERCCVGMNIRILTEADGSPRLMADALLLGTQALPRSWVLADPIRRMRGYIDSLRSAGQSAAIDDHDIASKHTTRLFYAKAALMLLEAHRLGPNVLISPRLALDDAVAMRMTQLRIDGDRLIIEFQMLNAAERDAWAKALDVH